MRLPTKQELDKRFAFDEGELFRTIRVDTLPVTIDKMNDVSGSRCSIIAGGHLIAEYFIHNETKLCYLIELCRLELCKTGVTSRQILDFDWDDLEAMIIPGKASNACLAKLEKRMQEGIHAFNLTVAASVAAPTFCNAYATGFKYPKKPTPIDFRAWHLIRAAASGNFGMACLNVFKMTTSTQQNKPNIS